VSARNEDDCRSGRASPQRCAVPQMWQAFSNEARPLDRENSGVSASARGNSGAQLQSTSSTQVATPASARRASSAEVPIQARVSPPVLRTVMNSKPMTRTCQEQPQSHPFEAQLRSELRACNDALDTLMKCVMSEIAERKELTAQMEKKWQAAVEEEAMVRRATAIHLETRISELLASGSIDSGKGVCRSQQRPETKDTHPTGLRETSRTRHLAMKALPESVEGELIARLDEGLQNEACLRRELETRLIGMIDKLSWRFQEIAEQTFKEPENTGGKDSATSTPHDSAVSTMATLSARHEKVHAIGDSLALETRPVRSSLPRRHLAYMGRPNPRDSLGANRRPKCAHEPGSSGPELAGVRPKRVSSGPTASLPQPQPEGPEVARAAFNSPGSSSPRTSSAVSDMHPTTSLLMQEF